MSNYYLIDSNNIIQNIIFFDGSCGDYNPGPGFKLVPLADPSQELPVLDADSVLPSSNPPPSYKVGDKFEG